MLENSSDTYHLVGQDIRHAITLVVRRGTPEFRVGTESVNEGLIRGHVVE